ncbi:MAG: RNase P subunit [Thaumarchaeota archaeon]|nr:RNase P subunit [Nitrososphaerota archaeon]
MPTKPSHKAKEGAAEIVKLLTESAVKLSSTQPELAKEQASLARKLRLRFNVRLDPSLKRFTCRGCKGLLVPGVNARVRLGHGTPTTLRITCADCGHVNRKILSMP